MSAPDPISLLQSILVLVDYGNQIAVAGKEMADYSKMIKKTADLVEDIRIKLTTLRHLWNDQEMDKILQEIQEANEELKSARGLVTRIEKSRPQWSKNVLWVFKNKQTAQAYSNAIAQSHSALRDINMRLLIMRLVSMRACSGDISGSFQCTASPERRPLDDISCRPIPREGKHFPIRRRSSLSHLDTGRTAQRNFKAHEPGREINMWLLKRAKLGTW